MSESNPYAPPTVVVDVAPQSDHSLAGRRIRLLAWLVDVLLGVASFLPGFLLMLTLNGTLRHGRDVFAWDDDPLMFATYLTLAIALAFQIYQWHRITTTGQTVAKRMFGLRIARTDDGPCGFVQGVLLRNWLLYVILAVPYLGIFLLPLVLLLEPIFIFGDERRCLHDFLAGTRVIVAPPRD